MTEYEQDEQDTRSNHSSPETPMVQGAFDTPVNELYRVEKTDDLETDYDNQTMKDVNHRPPERGLAASEDPDYHVSL